ncbi:hypothetical protein TWF696_002557 [Orbilia brochopaga]|uniref:Mid2 domain-containing protein n=1 Tax=Orbilia brochopaga TaxID=3140254 RepID=A0AAV9U2H3_9PEZI
MPPKAPSTTRWPSTSSLLCLLVALSPASVHAALLPTKPLATAITSTSYVGSQTPQPQVTEGPISTSPHTLILTITTDGTPTEVTLTRCTAGIDTSTPYEERILTATVDGQEVTETLTNARCLGTTPGVYPKTSKNGLSNGALAGIALGISIPILGAIGFFFWRLAKKRQAENGPFNAFHRENMKRKKEEREGARDLSDGDTANIPAPIQLRPRDPDIVTPPNITTHITAGR